MKFQGSNLNNETFLNYWKDYPLFMDLRIKECGSEACDPLHYWGPAKKIGYTIHYVLSGKGTLHYQNNVYHLKAGDGFVVSPEYEAYYEADGADPWSYRWIVITGSQIKMILDMTPLLTNPIFHYDKDSLFADLLAQIYASSEDPDVPDLLIISNALLFLAKLVKTFPSRQHLQCARQRDYILQATSYIEENYSSPIMVSDIASNIGLNRSYLYKLFQRYYGMSPAAFLEQTRLNHACDLLQTGKYTIQEIAYRCGYNGPAYFSSAFKKFKNVTPSQYIKHPFSSK